MNSGAMWRHESSTNPVRFFYLRREGETKPNRPAVAGDLPCSPPSVSPELLFTVNICKNVLQPSIQRNAAARQIPDSLRSWNLKYLPGGSETDGDLPKECRTSKKNSFLLISDGNISRCVFHHIVHAVDVPVVSLLLCLFCSSLIYFLSDFLCFLSECH